MLTITHAVHNNVHCWGRMVSLTPSDNAACVAANDCKAFKFVKESGYCALTGKSIGIGPTKIDA